MRACLAVVGSPPQWLKHTLCNTLIVCQPPYSTNRAALEALGPYPTAIATLPNLCTPPWGCLRQHRTACIHAPHWNQRNVHEKVWIEGICTILALLAWCEFFGTRMCSLSAEPTRKRKYSPLRSTSVPITSVVWVGGTVGGWT